MHLQSTNQLAFAGGAGPACIVRLVLASIMLVTCVVTHVHAQGTCIPAQTNHLTDPSGAQQGLFGFAVAMNSGGTRLACGNPELGAPYQPSGEVLIFDSTGSTWTQTASLRPAVQLPSSWFGGAIDIDASGDSLVVSAVGHLQLPTTPAYVYVFRRSAGSWIEEVRLPEPATPGAERGFGRAVSIDDDGNSIAVGDPTRYGPYPNNTNWGAVFLYDFDGTNWVAHPMLRASDTDFAHGFGTAVAMNAAGDVLAVSAPGADNNTGAVYVFERVGPSWTERQKLVPSYGQLFNLGLGVSLSMDAGGSTIVAGCPWANDVGGEAGAVHIFGRSSAGWYHWTQLLPSSPVSHGHFGWTVALDRTAQNLFVAYPKGSFDLAHWFARVGNSWAFAYELRPTDATYGEFFGLAIAPDSASSRVAIASPYDDDMGTDSGSVSMFEFPCAPPVVYCTAKTNSSGCVSEIASSGSASASSGSGFTVSAARVLAQNYGMLIYGVNGRAVLPFQSGWLCMLPPRHRTPLQFSGGGPVHACNGTFAFDFNTWVATASDPALVAGIRVQAQYWSRDGQAPGTSGLTDALDFYLAP